MPSGLDLKATIQQIVEIPRESFATKPRRFDLLNSCRDLGALTLKTQPSFNLNGMSSAV